MKKNTIYKYICLTLSAGILCSGCGSADSLTKNIKKQPVETVALDDYNSTITDFAVCLFQESVKNDQNTLVSPLSILNALAMTANGASGNTLVEMEETICLSIDGLNKYLYTYNQQLPNEDVTIADYISHLTGEQLYETLSNPIDICTWTKLPKFEYEYGLDMNEVLQKMGILDAFQEATADFSNMTEPTESGSNIYINKVLHQTFISVAEQVTKAGAATVVEMNDSAAPIMEYREVYLNRPFVYVIMDCENRIPIFIGMVGAV